MEKKRIAVFDFDASDCAHTAEAVRQYYMEQGVEASVMMFTESSTFAYNFMDSCDAGTPYDMTFIGVDTMRGVQAAWRIRGLDEYRPMFLVSDVTEYGAEGFRLHALDYLTKPVTPLRIGEAVRRIGGEGRPWHPEIMETRN